MKKAFLLSGAFCFWSLLLSAQADALFDDSRIASIFIELPADSFQNMMAVLENERYTAARFIFDDGATRDTVENAGLRLRGNTSLFARKKSFKISFNAFEPGREYQGVRKLNLRGQHNDPTMVREKLFYEVWKSAGMPERRLSFVRLYINNEYRGLYTNAEEPDKQWLDRVFDDNDGNLYKCNWPADLVYLGPEQQPYKAIMNNPEERAYDLKTNEEADDYSRLVALITALNQPVNAAFPQQIRQILNVETVLKAFALDVATGNWDDYFYNKNNYFLYDNPATGRFEFITFDTDNTFGVDWLGKDWAKRNCLNWLPAFEPRPLATQLLAVPEFEEQYVHYLDTITRFITHPDTIFPRIDALKIQIADAALADPYRTLDYGYTYQDFLDGFEQTVDNHTPYGIKPFLQIRYDSIRSQISGILSPTQTATTTLFSVYPNPAADWLLISPSTSAVLQRISLWDASGCLQGSWQQDMRRLDIRYLPAGAYYLRLESSEGTGHCVFLKQN
ncbi:MAG: CotH kinase family protein [Saprospiraceae bacterium]|nr:CotH kinase family protein [Saprospiraceae bacterium]